jgi:hypothetical protein
LQGLAWSLVELTRYFVETFFVSAIQISCRRIRFNPTILPPYARRTKSLEVLIPILYLKGISTGDFEEALAALVGKDAPCAINCTSFAELAKAHRQSVF